MVDDMENVFSEIVAIIGNAFPCVAFLDVFAHCYKYLSFIW